MQTVTGCRECGRVPADQWLSNEGPLCDVCLDVRIAALTGMPRLPVAPGPVEIVGSDGRRHVLRYRLWRAPTGISVRLAEERRDTDDGFEFAVLGDHEADVDQLAARVRAEAEAEIGRCYLAPDPHGAGWKLAGKEAAGRLVADLEGGPMRVVVDGRAQDAHGRGDSHGHAGGEDGEDLLVPDRGGRPHRRPDAPPPAPPAPGPPGQHAAPATGLARPPSPHRRVRASVAESAQGGTST
ncbi:hypothetical protein [Streptomyces sp. NPDC101455]|uniref:DUF7686 domain-containing protein n=1 Tax=Streptomyces sp. NPDC101455 TaxID=3366142 RepID=UPI0038117138